MLQIKSTPQHLGIYLQGNAADFKGLEHSIRSISPVGKYPCMTASRTRITRFVEVLKKESQNKESKCLSLPLLWTEALFITGTLSGFIKFFSQDLSGKTFIYDVLSSPKVTFNEDIAMVRLFQGKVLQELSTLLAPRSFNRILNIYGSGHTCFVDYTVQFLDLKNFEYLQLLPEDRLKKLSSLTQQILTRSGNYEKIEKRVFQLSREQKSSLEDVILSEIQYPKSMKW